MDLRIDNTSPSCDAQETEPDNDGNLFTMKVLITGGAGFLGSRLARNLLGRGQVSGDRFVELVVADLVPPPADVAADPRVRVWTGALLDQCNEIPRESPDLVFHLASAVSAECEADLDLGLRSNLDTTRALLDGLRECGRPRLVFSSSVAVFGGDVDLPLPRVIHDDTLPVPQTSYGIQKFMCEQLLADYTRRRLIDGRSVRLMTVTVRPGRPNAAASGFLSSIIREPLNGEETICPVPPEALAAVASPQRAIEGLLAAAEAAPEVWGSRTAMNLPGLTVSVREMLDALEAAGGRTARERVQFQQDPAIARMIFGWPSAFESARARRLGLAADPDFLSIIRQYQKEQAIGR
jgi:nucleoside-diphosphate-sugar epimerase